MNCMNRSIFIVADRIHQVDNCEDGDKDYENDFWLIKKVLRDVSVSAKFDVVDLEQWEDPEKCTRNVDEHRLLETGREIWRFRMPWQGGILVEIEKKIFLQIGQNTINCCSNSPRTQIHRSHPLEQRAFEAFLLIALSKTTANSKNIRFVRFFSCLHFTVSLNASGWREL